MKCNHPYYCHRITNVMQKWWHLAPISFCVISESKQTSKSINIISKLYSYPKISLFIKINITNNEIHPHKPNKHQTNIIHIYLCMNLNDYFWLRTFLKTSRVQVQMPIWVKNIVQGYKDFGVQELRTFFRNI